jgi:hypothetical protein
MIGLLSLALAASSPTPLATQAMHNFGACVAEETPKGARELLAMDFRTKDYERKMRAVAKGHERCVPGSRIAFDRVLFAGAMAEALVESDVKRDELPQRLAFDPARSVIAARSPTEAMALCTVLNAPAATAALFETGPASAEEVKALRPLGPVLGECLKKDLKVELNKPALRSLLALAAYRIVTTAKDGAQ